MKDPNDLIRRLRNHREMVNYGNGDVRDIPDEDCVEAADLIGQLIYVLKGVEIALARDEDITSAMKLITELK